MACEMESSAVQMYARAMDLMRQLGREGEPLMQHLTLMHMDEQEHLRRFRSLYEEDDVPDDRKITLSAAADGILFEGGLMGAARKGLLKDGERMMTFAMEAEAAPARTYRAFAEVAKTPEAKDALRLIAAEEDKHLSDLKTQAL